MPGRIPGAPDRRARKRLTAPRAGQRDLEGRAITKLYLDDKFPSRMHTLFIGVNPGVRSAVIGHYFGGHTNTFWKLFHASGLWPVSITTVDDDKVVLGGFGFTDTSKRPTPGINGLKKGDFLETKNRIRRIVAGRKPRMVVFVSKTALRAYLGKKDSRVSYGLQDFKIHDAEVFAVPSTSGASMADSSYRTKLRWFRRLKESLDSRGIRYGPT